ncbi:transposase [Candidatus Binatia bacterium]|nr:transposase [Candidatus Binatia bacterium]
MHETSQRLRWRATTCGSARCSRNRRDQATRDDPRRRRPGGDDDLRLGGRGRALPGREVAGGVRGLGPSVYQSAASQRAGAITRQSSKALRSALVQSAHVLTNRCRTTDARPLQAIGQRVRTSRGRRKIATVALARHLLRIAYSILRDGTTYDAKRLRGSREESAAA